MLIYTILYVLSVVYFADVCVIALQLYQYLTSLASTALFIFVDDIIMSILYDFFV